MCSQQVGFMEAGLHLMCHQEVLVVVNQLTQDSASFAQPPPPSQPEPTINNGPEPIDNEMEWNLLSLDLDPSIFNKGDYGCLASNGNESQHIHPSGSN